VLNAIRAMRGGNLNETRFGVRKRGEGVRADALASLFELTRRKLGLMNQPPVLATRNFQRPAPAQGSLF
ncbi:MAG: radical SAM protein, partial [Deltaproteobacteria bacterium]|nr:radical SAM protein [Deltaproteobacteria bacterium]